MIILKIVALVFTGFFIAAVFDFLFNENETVGNVVLIVIGSISIMILILPSEIIEMLYSGNLSSNGQFSDAKYSDIDIVFVAVMFLVLFTCSIIADSLYDIRDFLVDVFTAKKKHGTQQKKTLDETVYVPKDEDAEKYRLLISTEKDNIRFLKENIQKEYAEKLDYVLSIANNLSQNNGVHVISRVITYYLPDLFAAVRRYKDVILLGGDNNQISEARKRTEQMVQYTYEQTKQCVGMEIDKIFMRMDAELEFYKNSNKSI